MSGYSNFRVLASVIPFDDLLFLDAGSYTLTALVNRNMYFNYFQIDERSAAALTLSADFTNVPEPRWAFVVPLALLLVLWRPRRAGRSVKVAE